MPSSDHLLNTRIGINNASHFNCQDNILHTNYEVHVHFVTLFFLRAWMRKSVSS